MGTLHIVSRSAAPFRDRIEAGQLLSRELEGYRGQGAVVLGIPRGGIIVAHELAKALEGDLDIVLSRKLGAPGHSELAIGALAEDGKLFLNDSVVRELGIQSAYIQQERIRQQMEISRRSELIRRVLPKVPLQERLVIVTDDGVATGATMQAALWAVHRERPKRLIAALPVGPEETLRRLAEEADETLCLRAPSLFGAVGQFYVRFEQIEDEEVVRILKEEQDRKHRYDTTNPAAHG